MPAAEIKAALSSIEMLQTEDGQLNAVYALFGSAAQHSQHFEVALGEFLLVYNKACQKSLTLEELETIQGKLQKKTMGALLTEFRKHVTLGDDKVDRLLGCALSTRNYLMHHFFRSREGLLASEDGRMELLAELNLIGNLLQRARDLMAGMRVALSEAVSATRERNEGSRVLFTMNVDVPEP